jgi:hypothetical protein
MELTITQNGALYALQHGATKKYRHVRSGRVGADLIRVLSTLTTPMEKLRTRPIAAEKARLVSQNTGTQVADAFPEYRTAA